MKGKTRKFTGYAVYEWHDAEHTKGGSCTVTEDENGKRFPPEIWLIYVEREFAEATAKFLNENSGNDGPRWGVEEVQIATVR